MSLNWIYWFEEVDQHFNNLVGKKCANLGEMTRLGLRVPPGFALSVEAYKKFMTETGLEKGIRDKLAEAKVEFADLGQVDSAARVLREMVESTSMPQEMEEEIRFRYRELCRKCGVDVMAVATRSAGTVSHPGQYETHLNVVGEDEVVAHIKKVWSSSLNAISLINRYRHNLPLESDPIGVAVLKMVNAKCAGVLFTADPNTGDTSKMIIEANWGLGESVVGGEAMPDVLIMDKENLTPTEMRLGAKSHCIVARSAGVEEKKTSEDLCGRFCLAEHEAAEVCRLGKVLEEHFSCPQDIEWAVDSDLQFPDSVILLQTRAEVIAKQRNPVDHALDLMIAGFGA